MKATKRIAKLLVVGCVLAYGQFQNVNAQIPPGGGGGGGGTNIYSPPPDISNYLKYRAQSFLVLDTNAVASTDTNLFNALASFSDDAGTNPVLQVMPYQDHCLLFKASHFDYSGETARDFCLAVCDKVETPLYKTFNLVTASNNVQNGGWLAQGTVSHEQMTDPMFLMVSNTSRIYNGFFRAIPYGGPQVDVVGIQANDAVSNTINFQAVVTDLSGVTNVTFGMDAYGIPVRNSITGTNTISLDTRYNFNGAENLNFNITTKPTVYSSEITSLDNAKQFYSTTTVLPLDFENPVFLAYASDVASLDIGQNDIDFYATVSISYTASIKDLATGRTLKNFSSSASPGFVYLLWNFTEQDGTTPYTNDTYVVQFNVTSPNLGNLVIKPKTGGGSSFSLTNKIDDGVRKGAGCFITYQEEDPGDTTGSYWNDKADMWDRQTLRQLYVDQYKSLSLTQYTTDQVGTNRNHANCVPLSGSATEWSGFMPGNLANNNYSDLTAGGVHCDGDSVGYSKAYYNNKFYTYDLFNWVKNSSVGKKWRLRKTVLWGCWSGADTGSMTFPQACGIRPVSQQMTTYCRKNAGLFFKGGSPQIWVTGGITITSAQVSEALDQAFICGKNAVPGSCDPTYSIDWAIRSVIDTYPEMLTDPVHNKPSIPSLFGCPKLIDTTVYDDEITKLDFSHVKEN